MLFMPLTLVALNKVQERDAGVASSLVNTGQQVGGSIGLAILGTVAWTVVVQHRAALGRRGAGRGSQGGSGRPRGQADARLSWLRPRRPSPTTRWLSGSPAASRCRPGIALLALIITLAMIRVTKQDLEGVTPPGMAA